VSSRRTALPALLTFAALIVVALALAPGSQAGAAPIQGDTDCSAQVDAYDALALVGFIAGAGEPAACTDPSGDVNCDDAVDEADLLALLQHLGGLTLPATAGGVCPAIGEPLPALTATPTPITTPTTTSTATPTPTPTPANPTPSPTVTGTPPAEPLEGGYHLETIISGAALGALSSRKMELAPYPGQPDVAILVLQDGRMYRISLSGAFSPQLWGDLTTHIYSDTSEMGLLSLAFPPDFAQSGKVYVYHSQELPQPGVVARYDVVSGFIDEGTREVILEIEDFHQHHNGGRIVFDRNGYLLLGIGDGGGSNDPQETGQDVTRLLGKILRIDVSGPAGYEIPQDNPFAGADGAGRCNNGADADFCEEIFAFGMRNPWRMSIDRITGELWVGDVGQNRFEEVNHVVAGGNYGWDCREGFEPHEVDSQCDGATFLDPYLVYDHTEGIAIVGGYVYRGSQMPELYGWFVYADFATGKVWAVDTESDAPPVELLDGAPFISSFAELPDGELILVSLVSGIYRLARD
jgi:glucose/arabinose dehydrogenase